MRHHRCYHPQAGVKHSLQRRNLWRLSSRRHGILLQLRRVPILHRCLQRALRIRSPQLLSALQLLQLPDRQHQLLKKSATRSSQRRQRHHRVHQVHQQPTSPRHRKPSRLQALRWLAGIAATKAINKVIAKRSYLNLRQLPHSRRRLQHYTIWTWIQRRQHLHQRYGHWPTAVR